MIGDQVTGEGRAATSDPVRGRSKIEFPYLDFESALAVANAVHTVGGTSCNWVQLAGQMNQAPDGGGFRQRVMTSRMFGLLDYDRGSVSLNDLGIRAIDPNHARAARAEAFLQIPLYRALYERLNSSMLPPAAAIERMMESLGVPPKQKEKARQVFMRSAKQAGYFEINPERLIAPVIGSKGSEDTGHEEIKLPNIGGGGGGGNGGGGDELDPLISGLVKRLPAPGSVWSIGARVKWLQAAANNFDLIFEVDASDNGKSIAISSQDESGGLA